MSRHHHHATADEIIVFHGENEDSDYVYQNWQQSDTECDCGLTDPLHDARSTTAPRDRMARPRRNR